MLECGRGISKTKVHDQEIEGTIASSKGGLPLVARGNANKIVSTSEVDLGKDL